MSNVILIKQTVEQWLEQVDYVTINGSSYIPTIFALKFITFIKAVNADRPESHPSPVVHLKMLDKLAGPSERIANLCFRGMGKTSLFVEYLILYLAVFGYIDGFGEVPAMIYVGDTMENGAKDAKKNTEERFNNSAFLQEHITSAKFTEGRFDFVNKAGMKFGVKLFGAQTGLRGSKINGKRPVLAVLDDLVSDKVSTSKASMDTIKDTIYKGVIHALDPVKRKIIFNGTPFNKSDPLYEAVESGTWDVNVWPVCSKYPCSKEDFGGAWEERFSYERVKQEYDNAVGDGQLAAFNQELMLRISSDEEKLVQDGDIVWYDRKTLLNVKHNYNFYITTDFATSAKRTADLSVISVWAYSNNGDWFLVDGIATRQTMEKNMIDLFRLAQEYEPMCIGVETNGQQGGFVDWIRKEMINQNYFFNLQPIRAETDKYSRFIKVVPKFKAGKINFPNELKTSEFIGNFMSQISMATVNGLKGKDDCLDTISMLEKLQVFKPAVSNSGNFGSNTVYNNQIIEEQTTLSAYIV